MPAVGSIKVTMIGARTDSSNVAQTDWDQEEMRLAVTAMMRPGILPGSLIDQAPNPNAWRVRQDTGSNMQVKVGSGTSGADGLILLGSVARQGAYLLRLDSTGLQVAVPAADGSQARKYGVYAFIDDATYAGTTSAHYAGVSCIAGTPAGSPTVPAALSTWSAYRLLWSFQLAASASAVTNTILDNANATDGRTSSSLIGVNPLDVVPFI